MHFQPVEHSGDDEYLAQSGGGGQPVVSHASSNNALDDVFGGDDDVQDHSELDTHPSDMRRLESEHTNAGYREGVTVGKQQHLQTGFDQGYSMGAAIGMRAGQLFGLLEGVFEALQGQDKAFDELFAEAKIELSMDKLFSQEYWTGEGLWGYDVGEQGDRLEKCKRGAELHPLIAKWDEKVKAEMTRWQVDERLLDHVNAHAEAPAPAPVQMVEEPKDASELPKMNPLDW